MSARCSFLLDVWFSTNSPKFAFWDQTRLDLTRLGCRTRELNEGRVLGWSLAGGEGRGPSTKVMRWSGGGRRGQPGPAPDPDQPRLGQAPRRQGENPISQLPSPLRCSSPSPPPPLLSPGSSSPLPFRAPKQERAPKPCPFLPCPALPTPPLTPSHRPPHHQPPAPFIICPNQASLLRPAPLASHPHSRSSPSSSSSPGCPPGFHPLRNALSLALSGLAPSPHSPGPASIMLMSALDTLPSPGPSTPFTNSRPTRHGTSSSSPTASPAPHAPPAPDTRTQPAPPSTSEVRMTSRSGLGTRVVGRGVEGCGQGTGALHLCQTALLEAIGE